MSLLLNVCQEVLSDMFWGGGWVRRKAPPQTYYTMLPPLLETGLLILGYFTYFFFFWGRPTGKFRRCTELIPVITDLIICHSPKVCGLLFNSVSDIFLDQSPGSALVHQISLSPTESSRNRGEFRNRLLIMNSTETGRWGCFQPRFLINQTQGDIGMKLENGKFRNDQTKRTIILWNKGFVMSVITKNGIVEAKSVSWIQKRIGQFCG